ncbi:MAG: hypothetical protein IT324_31460 [Anaerolineae bacterium]|nr:hypothetical protein [Anaerolineae bacterium]
MKSFRVQIKFFVENPSAIELTPFIGVFQRWIQQQNFGELLVDVADYGHVVDGPGVILIGHESDYGMDKGGGRLGLLYTGKRIAADTLQRQLVTAFHRALTACQLLEREPYFKGALKFHTDETEIRLVDRLQYPNRPETFAAVRSDIQSALAEVYGNIPVSVASLNDDPRHLFTVGVRAEGAGSATSLLEQLPLAATE